MDHQNPSDPSDRRRSPSPPPPPPSASPARGSSMLIDPKVATFVYPDTAAVPNEVPASAGAGAEETGVGRRVRRKLGRPVTAGAVVRPRKLDESPSVKPRRGRPPKAEGLKGEGAKARGEKTQTKKRKGKEEDYVCFVCYDGGELVVCDRSCCPKVYHPECVNRDAKYFKEKGLWTCGWHMCEKCNKSAHYRCYTCTFSLCKSCMDEAEFVRVREKGFCKSCLEIVISIESSKGETDSGMFKDYWLEVKQKFSFTLEELTTAEAKLKDSNALFANGVQRGSSGSSLVRVNVSVSSKKKARRAKNNTVQEKSVTEAEGEEAQVPLPDEIDDNEEAVLDPDPNQMNTEGDDASSRTRSDLRCKPQNLLQENESQKLHDYAAIDVHNITLIYLRRNMMEDLIDEIDTFSDKVVGTFVRIRVCAAVEGQDIYRLVKVVGTGKATQKYRTGKKITDFTLEILNLNKTEFMSIDTISNQVFSEEECSRLRQSIKCGLSSRLTVGEIKKKASVIQAVRVKDLIENEKLRLGNLRDRASEKGRNKELRECVEKLQLLTTPEERIRMLSEVPEIHADAKMDPRYESSEAVEDDTKPDNSEHKRESFIVTRGTNVISSGKRCSVSGNDVMNSEQSPIIPCVTTSTTSLTVAVVPLKTIDAVNSEQSPVIPCVTTLTPSLTVAVVALKNTESEKVWHYKDPDKNVQGPFSLTQLRKWNKKGYFPASLGIWRTSEREEDSILLTDALIGKFQKDLTQLQNQGNSYAQNAEVVNLTDAKRNDGNDGKFQKGLRHLQSQGNSIAQKAEVENLMDSKRNQGNDVKFQNDLPSSQNQGNSITRNAEVATLMVTKRNEGIDGKFQDLSQSHNQDNGIARNAKVTTLMHANRKEGNDVKFQKDLLQLQNEGIAQSADVANLIDAKMNQGNDVKFLKDVLQSQDQGNNIARNAEVSNLMAAKRTDDNDGWRSSNDSTLTDSNQMNWKADPIVRTDTWSTQSSVESRVKPEAAIAEDGISAGRWQSNGNTLTDDNLNRKAAHNDNRGSFSGKKEYMWSAQSSGWRGSNDNTLTGNNQTAINSKAAHSDNSASTSGQKEFVRTDMSSAQSSVESRVKPEAAIPNDERAAISAGRWQSTDKNTPLCYQPQGSHSSKQIPPFSGNPHRPQSFDGKGGRDRWNHGPDRQSRWDRNKSRAPHPGNQGYDRGHNWRNSRQQSSGGHLNKVPSANTFNQLGHLPVAHSPQPAQSNVPGSYNIASSVAIQLVNPTWGATTETGHSGNFSEEINHQSYHVDDANSSKPGVNYSSIVENRTSLDSIVMPSATSTKDPNTKLNPTPSDPRQPLIVQNYYCVNNTKNMATSHAPSPSTAGLGAPHTFSTQAVPGQATSSMIQGHAGQVAATEANMNVVWGTPAENTAISASWGTPATNITTGWVSGIATQGNIIQSATWGPLAQGSTIPIPSWGASAQGNLVPNPSCEWPMLGNVNQNISVGAHGNASENAGFVGNSDPNTLTAQQYQSGHQQSYQNQKHV